MKKVVGVVLIAIFLMVFILFLVRAFSDSELDDVSPMIDCEEELLLKSDILWVIPLFENQSITKYSEWIKKIKSLNKTIGMHGIYHTYHELDIDRNEEYFNLGINEFEKTFGVVKIFKPSHLSINFYNKKYLESRGFKVYGLWHQITRKVYHCSDTGKFPNGIIDLF